MNRLPRCNKTFKYQQVHIHTCTKLFKRMKTHRQSKNGRRRKHNYVTKNARVYAKLSNIDKRNTVSERDGDRHVWGVCAP